MKAKEKKHMPPESKPKRQESFFNCIATLMTLLLQRLLVTSLEVFTQFICDAGKRRGSDVSARHPGFVIGLALDGRTIAFTPSFQNLEDDLLSIYDEMVDVVNNIPTVETSMPSESSRYPQKFLKVRHTDSNMHNEQKLN
jgi:dynein heavy chain